MNKFSKIWGSALLASSFSIVTIAEPAATPSVDELYKTIQKQQVEINNLKSASVQQAERLELTADAVDKNAHSTSATSIGGYAEMHYADLNNEGTGGVKTDKNEMDFHRFVMFITHEFNTTTRFFSELELEHSVAGESKKGEIELEQAYLEHDLGQKQKLKAGLFLVPVGILNETHEPNTFYGVDRNNVERNIIPTTWWEGGLAVGGEIMGGLSYDAALTSGLFLDTGKFKVRDGRQKVSEAPADDLATTIRLKYTGISGLELAISGQHQNDLTQSVTHDKIEAYLVESHAIYQMGALSLRALYATWNINSAIDKVKAGASDQSGFYVEPSYKLNDNWGFFVRVSEWDNQGADKADSAVAQRDIGLNYWLNPHVAFKFDYQDQNPEDKNAADEFDGFNAGVAVSF